MDGCAGDEEEPWEEKVETGGRRGEEEGPRGLTVAAAPAASLSWPVASSVSCKDDLPPRVS